MQCTGVWFAGGKFGLSWKAVQVRLDSVPAGLRGPAFQEDEDAGFTEPAELAPVAPRRAAAAASSLAAAPALEDDEETGHEQEQEQEEEEVAPPPVPKKTVVTKKKVVGGK